MTARPPRSPTARTRRLPENRAPHGQRPRIDHSWNVDTREAVRIQNHLRSSLILSDHFGTLRTVAGVDASFSRTGWTRAAAVVLSLPTLEILDRARATIRTTFPYRTGLLTFREAPAVLDALARLRRPPDLLICDGQGIAHPRRMGLAAHIGLLTDIPSIGAAKSRLTGSHTTVPEGRGEWVPLVDKSETIGAVLRTREGVRPLYISPGHRVSIERAVELVMRCVTRYRLPETTRAAHALAGRGRDRSDQHEENVS